MKLIDFLFTSIPSLWSSLLKSLVSFEPSRFTQYNRILRPSRPICVSALNDYELALNTITALSYLTWEMNLTFYTKNPLYIEPNKFYFLLGNEIEGVSFLPMDLKNEEPFQVS